MAKPDRNGLWNPRQHPDGLEAYTDNPPTTAKEAIDRGYNTYIDKNGVEQKMRYKSRANPRNGGFRYEVEPLKTRDANRGSDARRAATNEQTLSRQDYRDYAKRNGYSQKQADFLYDQNQQRLKEVRKIVTASRGGTNYEHLLPTRSPVRGGIEHWRNIIPMESGLNALKSDKLATIEAAREAGVPLTKSSALQMDFGDKPGVTWETQQKIILGDLETQGANVRTTRQVRQTLSSSSDVIPQGQKFKLISKGGAFFGKFIPGEIDNALLGAGAAGIAATVATVTGGNPVQAAGDTFSDVLVGDLEGGQILNEDQGDYGDQLEQAQIQNARPLKERLNEGVLGDVGRAVKRGPRWSIQAGSFKIDIPEFGYSELLGFNK